MTDNQIISERRGECRHENLESREVLEGVKITFPDTKDRLIGVYYCPDCELTLRRSSNLKPTVPDYSTNPAAWDSAMYEWIEGEGLANMFMSFLADVIPNCQSLHASVSRPKELAFMFTSSTPEQKAAALAKTIQEAK